MDEWRPEPAPPRDVLALARRDRAAAERALAALPVEQQVAAVCETPIPARAELLDLVAEPEKLVPLLPEAELCFTVKEIGLHDAVWLMELATPAQVVACVDLDAWKGLQPDRASLDGWIEALAEMGSEKLLASLRAIDPEMVVLFLKSRVEVWMHVATDEDWQPPPGAQTLDGVFFFAAKKEGDDLAPVVSMLQVLFEREYWTYFRMLQGVIWEFDAENETWAERWRAGRLEDLGFPSWDEAMQIYRYLPPERRADVPADLDALDVVAWHMPVWMPRLPAAPDARRSLYRAIAALDEAERRGCFYALVALSNKLAVADRLPLSDSESTRAALEKAVRFADDGLEFIAKERDLDPASVLRRVPLEQLFRVGANLDPEAAKPPIDPEPDAEGESGTSADSEP